MTAPDAVPPQAVEAAAEVLYNRQLMPDETPWHLTSDLDREDPREDAEAALAAAYPAIREREATRERTRIAFMFAGQYGGVLGQEQTQQIIDWITAGARVGAGR